MPCFTNVHVSQPLFIGDFVTDISSTGSSGTCCGVDYRAIQICRVCLPSEFLLPIKWRPLLYLLHSPCQRYPVSWRCPLHPFVLEATQGMFYVTCPSCQPHDKDALFRLRTIVLNV